MDYSTERLHIRPLTDFDAAFILELMTTDDCIKNISDRGLNTKQDALKLMHDRYMSAYPNLGLFVVETKAQIPIGTVSFLKRDHLEFIDIGYAFLPQFYGKGYAIEATKGLIQWAESQGINQLCAVVNPDNSPSTKLLNKLGFAPHGEVTMPGEKQSILYYELLL